MRNDFKKILKIGGVLFGGVIVSLLPGLPLFNEDIPQKCVEQNFNKIGLNDFVDCSRFDVQLNHDFSLSGSKIASEANVVIPSSIAKIQKY